MKELVPYAGAEGPPRRPRKHFPKTRETVELANHVIYFSIDNWKTIWRRQRGVHHRLVRDREEADRIRYLAVVKYGGGRDEA